VCELFLILRSEKGLDNHVSRGPGNFLTILMANRQFADSENVSALLPFCILGGGAQ
jgi:hypothetical protein